MDSTQYAVDPAKRTVGQLVADAIRLYGRRFWRSLALGLLATAFTVAAGVLDGAPRVVFALGAGPIVLAAVYVGAVRIAGGGAGHTLTAILAGAVAFLPLAVARIFVFEGIYFIVLAWFALTALAVPAVLLEGQSLRTALPRGLQLARADFVHAFGAVAALAIVSVVSIFALSLLLAGFGEQSVNVAAVLAVIVVSPLFFLGAALLYFDQKARLESRSRRERSRDADVHHAQQPDRSGRPDAEVKPGPAEGGQQGR